MSDDYFYFDCASCDVAEQVAEQEAEILRLRAENEKLRAALKPFADEAVGYRDETHDDYPITLGNFRLGQCRAAAAALKDV